MSREVLMPRISCSNVIHIPAVIQQRLMYGSFGDFISNPPRTTPTTFITPP